MEEAKASGDCRCRNQGRSYEVKCCPLPAFVSPHLPCPFGYLLPRSCLPPFVPWAFLPAGGTRKTLPAQHSPPWLPQAALPAATAALARAQLAGNEEQRREGRPETAPCHGSSWQKGGRNARKRLMDVWGHTWCSPPGEHLRGALCHVAAWVVMG